MFTAEITWVSRIQEAKKGGFYRRVAFRAFDGDIQKPTAYLNPEHRNYSRWEPLLKEGVIVKNLIWKDKEKGTIDGDSPVEEV